MHKVLRHSRCVLATIGALLASSLLAAYVPVPASTPLEAVKLAPSEYRHRIVQNFSVAEANAPELQRALETPPVEQRPAVAFLLANMPPNDLQALNGDFIVRNVSLAYQARVQTQWAKGVPEELFFNDVVPYVNLNEHRDDWRKDFYDRFMPLVRNAASATDAAQILNREIFNALKVKYHATKRHKPDQSPYESTEIGYASCTGLSILLVDACRAVGVPARVVGTPLWTDGSGNHTWVEVWDGQWRFVGAAEPGPMNQAWFAGPASKADPAKPENRIYAVSYQHTATPFPMIWARNNTTVSSMDVTRMYIQRVPLNISVQDADGQPAEGTVQVREAGVLVAQKHVVPGGVGTGSASPAAFELGMGTEYEVSVVDATGVRCKQVVRPDERNGSTVVLTLPAGKQGVTPVTGESPIPALRTWLAQPHDARTTLEPNSFADMPMTHDQAGEARKLLLDDHAQWIRSTRGAEWDQHEITIGEHTMKFLIKTFGTKPAGGWNLYISMHGGGNAPAELNDKQWQNQIQLYEPANSIYIAPRAPTNTWNMWHQAHIDPLFDRLIEDAVAIAGVDPEHVYLMGYSAGGDGVYQLAPRMADRLAAASMMAGHPNDASPLSLRNIGFAIHVGELDTGYDRNKIAALWKQRLDDLSVVDPRGYAHHVELHKGRPHWMNREDASAVPWMAGFTRNPIPHRVVWQQNNNLQYDRFYWLAVPTQTMAKGQTVVASYEGQQVHIERADGVSQLSVMLNDQMMDLDRSVTVTMDGKVLFAGLVRRTIRSLEQTLARYGDGELMFDAKIDVSIN